MKDGKKVVKAKYLLASGGINSEAIKFQSQSLETARRERPAAKPARAIFSFCFSRFGQHMSIVNSQITLCRFSCIKYQRHFHKAREIIDNGFWISRGEGKKQSCEWKWVNECLDGFRGRSEMRMSDAVFNFASRVFDKLSHREMNGCCCRHRLAVATAQRQFDDTLSFR